MKLNQTNILLSATLLCKETLHVCLGGGERVGAGHPLHLQRAACVPHILAHIRHHGSPALCRQILQGIY
jgi:hypothetical protein